MAFETGTYGSTVFAMTPSKIIPESGDIISWDWFDTVGLFSQRFLKMATLVATVAHQGTQTFTYTDLRCDFFPPYLKAYYYDTGDTAWREWVGSWIAPGSMQPYNRFVEVGLGTAKFVNQTFSSRSYLLLAYL